MRPPVLCLLALLTVVGTQYAAATEAPAEPVQVKLETALGDIDVVVFVGQAPLSAADFLRYVDVKLYDGAAFYRVVRPDNDHGNPMAQIVQGGLASDAKWLPGIAHETTRDTGVTHGDGTLSLARAAPGTGTAAAFFICIGDQPAFDYGGLRNPDGQGFAAFGKVLRGMEIVRKIQSMPATRPADDEYMAGQLLAEPVEIKRAYRVPVVAPRGEASATREGVDRTP